METGPILITTGLRPALIRHPRRLFGRQRQHRPVIGLPKHSMCRRPTAEPGNHGHRLPVNSCGLFHS
jgi:hypothetical protein